MGEKKKRPTLLHQFKQIKTKRNQLVKRTKTRNRYPEEPFRRNCSRIVSDSRINFCKYIYIYIYRERERKRMSIIDETLASIAASIMKMTLGNPVQWNNCETLRETNLLAMDYVIACKVRLQTFSGIAPVQYLTQRCVKYMNKLVSWATRRNGSREDTEAAVRIFSWLTKLCEVFLFINQH